MRWKNINFAREHHILLANIIYHHCVHIQENSNLLIVDGINLIKIIKVNM